jgi:hypothetical protein
MSASSQARDELVFSALRNEELLRRHFPMLFRPGIPDYATTVHSHFLTYLATLGQSLGYAAVTESPVQPATVRLARYGEVRSDSIWFNSDSLRPEFAFEFERFERGDEAKLRGKVENLVIASHQSQSAVRLCTLIYWVRSGSVPRSLAAIFDAYYRGFRRNGRDVPASSCALMVVKCVLKPSGERLIFSEFLRDREYERPETGRTR